MRSMTGFGQARAERDSAFVTVEISSVNNRHCEVNFSLSQDLSLEKKVVNKVKKRVDRGNVEIQVKSNVLNETEERLDVNQRLIDRYIGLIGELSDEREALVDGINAIDLLDLPGILSLSTENKVNDEAEELLLESVERALDKLIAMREREGEELKKDLMQRRDDIESKVLEIKERFPEAMQVYREKLKERFDDILEFDDTRIEEELESQVKMYAEKCDISEELVRLESHLKQFEEYLNKSGSIGKQLKFLLQEMQREINTVSAKANDAVISQTAVEVKSQLEKCREQVKNVE